MSSSWYALRSKPRKEDSLWRQASLQGFEVFYPRLKVEPVNPRSRKIRPYFPGYMFVKADLVSVGISKFHYMPHSIGLVAFGGEPAVVPEALVYAIRRRVGELAEAGGELYESLKHGTPVWVRGGPFEGYKAVFDARLPGSDRVRILLQMISGRSVPVELRAGLIEQDSDR